MHVNQSRLKALVLRLGTDLPSDFLRTLTDREPIREGDVALHTPDRVWDVRTSFSLDDGKSNDQLDHLYELVGDVLPPGALPFAADWGDNFYCLMLSGPYSGQVVYWFHEREAGDNRVEPVASSVDAFYAGLLPETEDE